MHQLPLMFEHFSEYLHGDFIVSNSNCFAYQAVMDYQNWPNKRLLLVGENGSGKTHLATIWQEMSGACLIKPHMDWPTKPTAILVENLAHWMENEQKLLHLLNSIYESNSYLLITASTMPSFALPDLQSRLNSMHMMSIKPPDQALLKALIVKQLCDRQLQVKPEVLEYLCHNIERSFTSVQKLITAIDQLAMQEKRGVTLPLVKRILVRDTGYL